MYECDHGFVGEGGICVPYVAKDMPAAGTDAPAAAPEEVEKESPVVEATPEEAAAPAGGDCMSPLELVAGQDDLSTLASLVEVSFRSMCSVCFNCDARSFTLVSQRARHSPAERIP